MNMTNSILTIYLAIMVLNTILFIRNLRVGKYRGKLIQDIHNAGMIDIENGTYMAAWRYEAFDSVSYNKMVLMFWKPLDSFYKDRSFLEPLPKKGIN